MLLIATLFLVAGTIVRCEVDNNKNKPQARQIAEHPCNCYFKDSCGCVCPRPLTWSQFQLLPQNFKSCRAFTLALRGGSFHSFPADYFYRVGRVQDFVLDVGNVEFQALYDLKGDSSPFNGVSLDVTGFIRFFKVIIYQRWNWNAFYWLVPNSASTYCEVQVVQSTMPVVDADFARICQGLVTVVNIISSGVAAIDTGAFATFYKMAEFDVSNNRIQEIKRSYFPYPANALQIMNLANNNIWTLPNDMFSQMPALQVVNVRGNPISTLDERTFRPIFRNVEIEGLESLPLSCDCKSRWMKEPVQMNSKNVFGLAGVMCKGPTKLKGLSFFNETLPKDLVCETN